MERFKRALWRGSVIIILGLIFGLGINAMRHDGLPLLRPGNQEITVVSVADAWKVFRQGKAVFLDAREAEVYRSAHLPGALHVPLESVKAREAELKKLAGSNKMFITYCDGQGCSKARDLATALSAERIPGIAEMPDGWQGWMEAGFPVDEGGQ